MRDKSVKSTEVDADFRKKLRKTAFQSFMNGFLGAFSLNIFEKSAPYSAQRKRFFPKRDTSVEAAWQDVGGYLRGAMKQLDAEIKTRRRIF